ncbi:class I SAM-dependent methyltransferase [Candidatus Saganbacteria bacterium]|nr:class I SAM-dependent methyltransferase [Candidatus Saganbacteria bacterium]
MELKRPDLEYFIKETTGTPDLYEIFEKTGFYGSQEALYSDLNKRLVFCMNYLNCDLKFLIETVKESLSKTSEKDFEKINETFYQDKMHPIVMTLFYSISEPFLLRSIVKREILYLAFKLEKIDKMLIGGVGCGEIIDTIEKLPLVLPEDLRIKGVDISRSAIDFCNNKFKGSKIKMQFELSDLDKSDYSENYDLVELSEVLEHIRDPKALLKKIGEKAKLTFVTIPIMLNVPEHIHLFNIKDIVQMVREANLDMLYFTVRSSLYVKQHFFFGLLRRAN